MCIAPSHDIRLAYQIHRADELHPIEVGTAQLGHHRLHLRPVEHAHQYSLDDIIVVMTERDLVAAQLLCSAVQISPAHTCAQIARRLLDLIDGIEDIGLEDGDGYTEHGGIALDELPVDIAVSRIHHEKYQLERELAVPLQLLKELRHQHGVFAAGDAYRDLVALAQQLIAVDRLRERGEELLVKCLADAQLRLQLFVRIGKTVR